MAVAVHWCECGARVFIHSTKVFVIAYRPAKASSSHNNLTATEWTAHTIFIWTQNSNARATTTHNTRASIQFYLHGGRATDTFWLCAHTLPPPRPPPPTNQHTHTFSCKYFSISTVDHNVWLLFKKRLNLTLTQNTKPTTRGKKKTRTFLARLNVGEQCARGVVIGKTESIVKTNSSVKH